MIKLLQLILVIGGFTAMIYGMKLKVEQIEDIMRTKTNQIGE